MPLTPAEVHNAKFRKPPMGKRGYDEDEVDAFLDQVEAELARLLNENADLRAQLDTLGRGEGSLAAGQPDAQPATADGPAVDSTTTAVTSAAPAQSDPASPAAVIAAEPRGDGDAEREALRTLVLAQRTADAAVAEARSEATSMLEQARAESERLDREARERTEALDRDAEARHQQAVGGLVEVRRALEQRIEDLRQFEREYRSRLRAYLQTQLHELDGRQSVATLPAPAAPDPGTSSAESSTANGAEDPPR